MTSPKLMDFLHAFISVDLCRLVDDEVYADNAIHRVREVIGDQPLVALINNAAVQILGGVDSLSREDWRRSLGVNLVAPFFLAQAFLPDLERAQGNIVNISSIHARLTKRNFVAYATSKSALSGMTRSMALDLGARVRVNAIEPAAIDTQMLRAGLKDGGDSLEALGALHPQNRVGSPEEVGDCVVAIIQQLGKFVHGACIAIDGGIGGKLSGL